MSERELSRQAGLSDMAVNYIVSHPDSQPKMETCIRLAEALEIPAIIILELAGYGRIDLPENMDPEVSAFASYVTNLSQEVRAHILDVCWAIVDLVDVFDGSEG
jgi:hypothetical protein